MTVAKDTFSFKGEVLEILDEKGTYSVKIICKPSWILLNIENISGLELGDIVMVEGNFSVRSILNIDPNKITRQKAEGRSKK